MQRHTDRLRLTPIGPDHAEELWQLHQDPGVATWYGGILGPGQDARRAPGRPLRPHAADILGTTR